MDRETNASSHAEAAAAGPAAPTDDFLLDDVGLAPPTGNVDPASLRTKLVTVLRSVYDPELPVNVYDLGLIYRLDVDAAGHVETDMTLTAPACPIAGEIVDEVHRKVRATPGVASARTRLVWEPPWSADCMSQAVRLELGLL